MTGTSRARLSVLRLAVVRIAVVAAALSTAGCGGDDDPTGPNNSDIDGQWTFQATGTDDTGRTCVVSDVTISITRNGSDLDGTMTGGGSNTIACNPGSTTAFNGSSPLESIAQSGQNVEFTFQSSSGTWTVTGSLSGNGNTMNGAVTFFLTFSASGVKQFSGTWTATRT